MMAEPISPKTACEADEWFGPGRFAALLGLLIFASFPEVVTLQATFYHRDFAIFGYPLAYYQRQCFWRGEIPLWTPLSCCGLPFLAQWNTMTLYPLSLFYLLLPLPCSLGLFCLGHLFLAGLGMYFLAHHWTGNRFAAALSGIAFVFSALMLNCLMWPNNMAGLGWMPWVVWTVERGWREGGRELVPGVLTAAMQMLSGAPEVILLTWVVLGAMLVFSPDAEQSRGNQIGRFMLTATITAGLAAVQLLPFLDLLAHSNRSTNYGDATWSMPLWGWANLLVPLFRAHRSLVGTYFQPGQYWIGSYYLGIGTIALALLAAWQMRQPRARVLATLTLVCLVLALGDRGLLYAGLRRVLPGLGFMRFPVKFVILPAFAAPLLAGLYVGYFQGLSAPDWLRQPKKLVQLGALIAVLVLAIIVLASQFPVKGVPWLVVAGNGMSRLAFPAALFGALLIMRQAHRRRLKSLLRFGAVALLWLDTMTIGPRPNPVVDPAAYEAGLIRREIHMTSLPHAPESRAMLRADTELEVNHIEFADPKAAVLYGRLALFANANLLDDIPKTSGFYSLYLPDMGDLVQLLEPSPQSTTWLPDFLGVSQVNVPGRVTEWLARPSHLPWITGGQRPVFASDQMTVRALAQADFDPRQTVFLPLEARGFISATNASQPRIAVQEFSGNRSRLKVESAEPALVVIAQSFYHYWKASVDGHPVRLWRANRAFQAVEVPAGSHELNLVYQDQTFRWGAIISALSLLVCAVLWFRRPKSPGVPPGCG